MMMTTSIRTWAESRESGSMRHSARAARDGRVLTAWVRDALNVAKAIRAVVQSGKAVAYSAPHADRAAGL